MKKLVALLLAFALILSSVTAFAAFPDLRDSKWDWARESIDEMTDKGIIAGYPDGNFGPADGVTKLQSLLLMSRILGFYQEEMKNTVSKAKELYGDIIEPYGISNPDEIAFLMYYGALKESELSDYLEDANSILKRYEAAILLTKTAGAEAEVLSGTISALKYTDTPSIPATARRYVNYVSEKGYMVGMTETTFEPETTVTRAQMAAMLYRIMKDLDIKYLTGDFVSYENGTLTLLQAGVKNQFNVVTSNTEIKVNGVLADKSSIPAGGYTVVKYYGKDAKYIDAFSVEKDDEIKGTVTSLGTGVVRRLGISPVDGSGAVSLAISDTAIVTLGGARSNYSEIKRGDTVTVVIQDGVGKTVDIAPRSDVINGAVFDEIAYQPYPTVTITTTTGEKLTKVLSSEVSVSRNNKLTELTDLIPGDKLTVTLKNDYVTKIKATSIKSETEGTVEVIHFSASPYIVIKAAGESIEYSLAKDVAVIFEDKTGTIYDLRVGNYVVLEVESNTVKTITTTTPEAAANTVTGIVEGINTDYNFFYLNVADTATGSMIKTQIFTKKSGGTKFIDSADGTSISLGKMKEGSTAFVTGVKQLDGSYIATAVVVIASAE